MSCLTPQYTTLILSGDIFMVLIISCLEASEQVMMCLHFRIKGGTVFLIFLCPKAVSCIFMNRASCRVTTHLSGCRTCSKLWGICMMSYPVIHSRKGKCEIILFHLSLLRRYRCLHEKQVCAFSALAPFRFCVYRLISKGISLMWERA